MRTSHLASLLVVVVAAGACSAERLAPAPVEATPLPESLAMSVRGTQMGHVAVAAPAPGRAPVVSSTSPAGPVWIETTCQDLPVDAQLAQFQLEYSAAAVVELGRAARLVDHGVRQQLAAWDTDSNCRVDVIGPKDVDAVAIARTLLGTLRS